MSSSTLMVSVLMQFAKMMVRFGKLTILRVTVSRGIIICCVQGGANLERICQYKEGYHLLLQLIFKYIYCRKITQESCSAVKNASSPKEIIWQSKSETMASRRLVFFPAQMF